MDKNKLKTFAIESRRQLIEDITFQANLLGISKEKIQYPIEEAEGMQAFDIGGAKPYIIYDEDIDKRNYLVQEVIDKGFDNVIEEVAYTWFNRIIAIRYMEVNDYLPTKIRVLSSETSGKIEPDIIGASPDIDLNLTSENKKLILQLKAENKTDDLFQFLFIKQCNKLNEILPGLFEKTKDYMEILLNITYTNPDGVIQKFIKNISEEDFKNQVEIFGWIYQYYNTELKDETFKNIQKNKVSKEHIPHVTQLFTPDWIVKYMVENSLGRLWIESHPNSLIKNNWNYFLEESEQNLDVEKILSEIKEKSQDLILEDIKIIDPCMGSGHILVYVFDVLMEMYESIGYLKKDAVLSILKNNLFGLDIDDRAYQIAYFAVMMKSRSFYKNIFNEKININLCTIKESNLISNEFIRLISNNNEEVNKDLINLKNVFNNAKEYGSILILPKININNLYKYIEMFKDKQSTNLNLIQYKDQLELLYLLLKQYKLLYNKYEIVITNPPYMSSKGMNNKLKDYLKKYYPLSKSDLYAVFLEKCNDMVISKGFCAMITQQSFMFISSYAKLRKKLLNNIIINMVHLGPKAFEEIGGEVVQVTSFIQRNIYIQNYISKYCRLINFNNANLKKEEFFNQNNYYLFNQNNFNKIPLSPISYWADNQLINAFNIGIPLKNVGNVKKGHFTGDNNRFLRYWYEVDKNNIGLNFSSTNEAKNSRFKWFPYNKGGSFRKWYGNQEYVVNWQNDGEEIKNSSKSGIRNPKFHFHNSLSWSLISSNIIAFRYYPKGFLFDSSGPSIFLEENFNYIFGFLNSSVCNHIIKFISPTLSISIGSVSSLPIIFNDNYYEEIDNLVNINIKLCESDWNDYELSLNFTVHPLVKFNNGNLKNNFEKWKDFKNNQFNNLKSNEIKINKIFSEIYSINLPTVFDNEKISINLANYEVDIKSLISYIIGCLFGRYSLDEEGLVCGGGEFDLGAYSSFVPDEDNIVPVLDSEYFDDDVVGRFVEFVKVAFGSESLEENLDFIAGALKNKGSTSREVIRSYFLNDFFKDHVKMYKKCPIYWLFDSGKENGFKCLVYMHRYSPDLVARVRTDYLHKTQKAIESQISYEQNIKENSGNSKDQARADKRIKKLTKQLDETRRYDEALAYVASQNISIDLDDGVKVNYAKFQNVEVSKEGQKVKKINLLKKI